MKAAIYTLGCKVNTYESAEISRDLVVHGYMTVPQNSNADIYIINSCTVTAESNRKTRQLVRKIRNSHPDSVIVLTGCMPQAFPEEARLITEADIITGNKSNRDIPRLIDEYLQTREKFFEITEHEKDELFEGIEVSATEGHTRAFLKIQDGCNRFCSYCAIPYARGRSRSRKLEDIASCAKSFGDNGYCEIVLVGINLSAYGRELGNLTLADAVSEINKIDAIKRIRLGSLEPDHITKEMISELKKNDKLCPQFHISLQSGSNTVLKRMNRHYTAEEYAQTVINLRTAFPDCSVTTDIICGFPGETEEEFLETVEFVKQTGFEKVHIFPYSIRKGTRAAVMENQIQKKIKEERCAILADICAKERFEFMSSHIGKTFEVLFETPKNGIQRGYTRNYIPVAVKNIENENLTGRLLDIKIISADSDGCIGEIIK